MLPNSILIKHFFIFGINFYEDTNSSFFTHKKTKFQNPKWQQPLNSDFTCNDQAVGESFTFDWEASWNNVFICNNENKSECANWSCVVDGQTNT